MPPLLCNRQRFLQLLQDVLSLPRGLVNVKDWIGTMPQTLHLRVRLLAVPEPIAQCGSSEGTAGWVQTTTTQAAAPPMMAAGREEVET